MPEENSQVYRTIGTDKPILMNESCLIPLLMEI